MTKQAARRPRARVGDGGRLRDEILAAARAIVRREGDVSGVTLRSVARELGIAAPSIYLHFEDLDQLLTELLRTTFADLRVRLVTAIDQGTGAEERMRLGCLAYCGFALDDPASYRLLFTGPLHTAHVVSDPTIGFEEFGVLVQGVADVLAAHGRTDDPFPLARMVWVGLHGQVSLRAGNPGFPWDPLPEAIDRLIADTLRP